LTAAVASHDQAAQGHSLDGHQAHIGFVLGRVEHHLAALEKQGLLSGRHRLEEDYLVQGMFMRVGFERKQVVFVQGVSRLRGQNQEGVAVAAGLYVVMVGFEGEHQVLLPLEAVHRENDFRPGREEEVFPQECLEFQFRTVLVGIAQRCFAHSWI